MHKKKRILAVVSLLAGVAVLVTAVYIMVNGIGLQDSLDFGAGAYYYADIPEFERYTEPAALSTSLPLWVYFALFFAWGGLMYFIWTRIEKNKKQ